MPNAIELQGLSKAYRGLLPWTRDAVQAVRDITLTVPDGEIFGLLGPNGAGKTTTIKMIAGLIVPDQGSISFPSFARKPRIGAVLEGSRNLYWRLSAWENVLYFGEVKGVPLRVLKRQGLELLELFGLAERRHRPAQTLSRGMQQKLAVVLAFLGEPQLLLLDEPTLGLDVASSQTIQRLLKELCRERGITIVVTTHQMDVAQSLCRRVAIMREGQVALCERVDALVDLFKRQDYIVRLDLPAWQELSQELASFDFELMPEEREGQVALRFKLKEAIQVYALVDVFKLHAVALRDFRQELPTLEDIFISVTSRETGGPAGAAPMEERR